LLPAPALPPPGAASTSCPWPGTSRWPSPAHVGPAPTGQSRHRACPDPGGSGPRAHELSLHVLLSLCHNFLAQFLTLCRASNLAEALRISSPLHSPSPAKRRASLMSPRIDRLQTARH